MVVNASALARYTSNETGLIVGDWRHQSQELAARPGGLHIGGSNWTACCQSDYHAFFKWFRLMHRDRLAACEAHFAASHDSASTSELQII